MVLMVILIGKHVKDLFMGSRIFPFVALILTPLVLMHVFTIDVRLAEVTKLLMARLF